MTKNNPQRTFVLGLDGVPYSFLQQAFAQGRMPNLSALAQSNKMKRINSVYPTISSVAWTSYMTGTNPAGHNIFGFVDRVADPFSITIPTARQRKAKSIWAELSRQGRRTIVINVPLTYPPEEVNGILVSGFLCTDIKKCTYPADFSGYLKEKGYIIDVDAWLARNDQKKEFMHQLHLAMEKRFELAEELMQEEKWDFCQLHIMETDRLFHFFWDQMHRGGEFAEESQAFFAKIDDHLQRLRSLLSPRDRILILSDHGFCGVKKEVQLNAWLMEQGLLRFRDGSGEQLSDYSPESICYSLIPGRIFINLKGREEKGSVARDDYQKVRDDIKARILELSDPDSGEPLMDKVFYREEIYDGPYLEDAADIIAHPRNGYDLKARVGAQNVFDSEDINGMHTYDDAFALGVNLELDTVSSVEDFKNILLDK